MVADIAPFSGRENEDCGKDHYGNSVLRETTIKLGTGINDLTKCIGQLCKTMRALNRNKCD